MPVSVVEILAFKRAQRWVQSGESWGLHTLPGGKTIIEASYDPTDSCDDSRVTRLLVIENNQKGQPSPFPLIPLPDAGQREYRELYQWFNARGLIRESFRPRKGSLWMMAKLNRDETFEFKMRWL
jgi:hypothetical protein